MMTANQLKHRMCTVNKFSDLLPIDRLPDLRTSQQLAEGVTAAIRTLLTIFAGQFSDTVSFAGISDYSKATLVYFRGEAIGKQDSLIQRIVQIPYYFGEVKPYQPISRADMESRESFARQTGFLLLGPDEFLAIEHQTNWHDPYKFVDAFENNDLGSLRQPAGFYADSLDYRARPVTIAELNVTQVKHEISEKTGDLLWWHKILSAQQRLRLTTTLSLLSDHQAVALPERLASGAIIERSFIENGDTGSTLHMRPYDKGWRKYPTPQDAWYYGCWINPVTRQTLTYAEQDVSLVTCDNVEQFCKELQGMAQFHGRHLPPSMTAYGPDGATLVFDCMTLLDGRVKSVIFQGTGEIDQEHPGRSHAPLMAEMTVAALERVSHCVAGVHCPLSLDRDYAMNLLDPRSSSGNIEMQASYQGDDQFVFTLILDGKIHMAKATYSLEVATA